MIPTSNDGGAERDLAAALLALRPPQDDFIAESIRAGLRRDLGGVASPLRWGRYAVTGRLGGGRLGPLYEAVDVQASRRVVIRVLRRRVEPSEHLLHFSHPNLVEVFDGGIDERSGRAWLVTELVEGVTLPRWLDREPRSLADLLGVLRGAARGLAAAHVVGVRHGALRAEDIFVVGGLARVANVGLTGRAVGTDDDVAFRGILEGALRRCRLDVAC